jgi:hypothetical protein
VNDPVVGVTVAWCSDEAELGETRQLTHDHLVELMGDTRAGPVHWQWYGEKAALETVGNLLANAWAAKDDPAAAEYATIMGLIAAEGGFLVIASAEVH